MAGGAPEAFERVGEVLRAIAAVVDGTPCCAHVGADGAGHFVKMIHNGIEYADMQLIAETYALMQGALGLDYPAMQRGVRRMEPRRARFLPDRDHRRHPRQARPRDRPADGRGDPRSRRPEGHRRLGGGGGARARRAGADDRRGGRRALALGAQGRARRRGREARERPASVRKKLPSRRCAMRCWQPSFAPMRRASR